MGSPLNNNVIPSDLTIWNDYAVFGHSHYDHLSIKPNYTQRQILARQSELGGRKPALGFQTNTSRELFDQRTADGTRLPEAISWENILRERKLETEKVLMTQREFKEKQAIKENENQRIRDAKLNREREISDIQNYAKRKEAKSNMDLVLGELKMKPVSLKKVEKTMDGLIIAEQFGGSESSVGAHEVTAVKSKRGRKPIEVPKLPENIADTIKTIEARRDKYKQNPNPNKKEHKKTLDAFAKHLRTLRKRMKN